MRTKRGSLSPTKVGNTAIPRLAQAPRCCRCKLLLANTGQIKLLDLGLALLGDEVGGSTELTSAGKTFGTPDYMAPEQWADAHAADALTDLYALGCTLCCLPAGYAP